MCWVGYVGHPSLGEQNIEEQEGKKNGTENTPAEPPVDTQLHVEHEVEVSSDLIGSIDPSNGHDLHSSQGQDEDGSSVIVHHLQHYLAARRHIEQTNAIT